MNAPPELILTAIACVPLAITVGVAAAVRRRTGWPRGLVLGLIGVSVPLAIFLLSCFLKPDAKSQCKHGWVDCLQTTKLAMLPLVLWALVAVLRLEKHGVQASGRTWNVAALAAGLLVSGTSTLHYLLTNERPLGPIAWFLLVPIGVYIWLAIWWWRLFDADRRSAFRGSLAGAVAFTPFAAWSAAWAARVFAGLPEHPPDCFVVTAASRGHGWMTGPRLDLQHRGQGRQATRQLAVFWQLEELWQVRAPSGHRRFRRVYNRIGPALARHINRPWKADLALLFLLPFEGLAWLILRGAAGRALVGR